MAGSINELIDTNLPIYRPLLAHILREMQDIHGKYCNAQKNLTSLLTQQTNSFWPSFIAGMHDPFGSIQMSKETRSPKCQSLTDAQNWFKYVKEEALIRVIALKEAKVEHLEKLYSPPSIRDRCSKELDNAWANLKKAMGKFTEDDGSGQGIAIPRFFKTEFASAKELVPSWVAKSWDFTRIKSSKLSKELEKKKELAQQAADAMDTNPDRETLTETVAKAVAAALRQQNKPAGNKRGKDKVRAAKSSAPIATNSSLGKRKEPWTEEVPRGQQCEQTLRHKSPGLPKRRKTETDCEQRGIRSFCKEGEEGKEDIIRSCRWSVSNPSSIPREILDLAPETALSIIQSRVPLTTVSNADIRIKLGPGVMPIPAKIDNFLLLGHRFLLPPVFNVSFPLKSFSSLSTRIKWKVFFTQKQNPSSFLDRNPQYRIPKPETLAVPATTPRWVEDMLDRGRTELINQLRAIPDSAEGSTVYPNYQSELKILRNWRNQNNLLVLQSDKNLGTTIVSSKWYNEKLDALVLNNRDFTERTDYHGKFIPVFDEIRRCENKHLPSEVKDFILASCNVQEIKLPRFHGLLKIHKNP